MRFNPFQSVRSRGGRKTRRRTVFSFFGLIALAFIVATAGAFALDQPNATSSAKTVVVPVPPVRSLNVRVWTDQSTYTVGDDVSVHFQVNRDARVYIFDTDASGRTTQIFPNGYDRNNFVQGGVEYSIPDTTYRLVATGPVGWESLHIVAYGSPAIYFPEYQSFPDPTHPFPLRPEGAIPILDKLENGEGWGVVVPANSTAPSVTAPSSPDVSSEATSPSTSETSSASNTEQSANPNTSTPPSAVLPPQPQGNTQMTVVPRPLQYGDDQTQFYVAPVVSYSTPYTETYPYYSLYPNYYPLYTYPYYYYRYPRYGEYHYRGHERFGHFYGVRPRGYEYRGFRSGTRDFHSGTREFHSGTREFHSGTREFHSGTREFHSGTRQFHASPGRGSFGSGDFNRGGRQGIQSRGGGNWGSHSGGESHFGGGSRGGSRGGGSHFGGGGARGGRR